MYYENLDKSTRKWVLSSHLSPSSVAFFW